MYPWKANDENEDDDDDADADDDDYDAAILRGGDDPRVPLRKFCHSSKSIADSPPGKNIFYKLVRNFNGRH